MLVKHKNRDNIIISLKEQGVETNLGAQALHCLTYFSEKYNYQPEDFPNARIAYQHGLALPLGNHLIKNDIEKVCQILKGLI